MVRILSGDEVRSLLDMGAVLQVVENALLAQATGDVERPERPHYPIGVGLDEDHPTEPLGTGLVMPAYLHGSEYFSTKLVSVYPDNPDDGLPTTTAQIVLGDAETGQPVAFMDGTQVTGARTGSIGGLAARELTTGPVRVAVVGAGTQARWQVRAIDAATTIESVAFYSPSPDSRSNTAERIRTELGIETFAAEDPDEIVAEADVVVTATTSSTPVFSGDALTSGTVVVAVGAYTDAMQELDARTFERADAVFADVPSEVAAIGDLLATDLEVTDLVPFADVLSGDAGRGSVSDIVVVESVGSAVMDAATAAFVYEAAIEDDVGGNVSL